MTLPAGVHVRVVGTGLIGASIGLALTRTGAVVSLEDPSTTACALARDLGAGVLAAEVQHAPALVVVAAPPDAVAAVVVRELAAWPEAVVTDVASVKLAVLEQVTALGGDLRRYVGSHPMAGRERSGAIAAQADLFEGRSWVVASGPAAGEAAVAAVLDLAVAVGAAPIRMTPADHDAAVAAVSHVPQIAASLVAARLRELPDSAVALAGQGIRDVTRIAASDPMMWTQILAGNAPALRTVLEELAVDLDAVLQAVRALDAGARHGGDGQGARGVLARAVASGNAGHARIPGKHGSAPTAYATVTVLVPDEPGALGRLFQDVGEADVNLEDLHLEHGIGAPVGLAELAVLPAAAEPLTSALLQRGWRVHD